MDQDIFDCFAINYVKNEYLLAWQCIITKPDCHYDALISQCPFLPQLINYADACAFKGISTIIHMNHVLQKAIESENFFHARYFDFLDVLKTEYKRLTFYNEEEISSEDFLEVNQKRNEINWQMSQQFIKAKPQLAALIKKSSGEEFPHYAFSYARNNFLFSQINKEGNIPFIFFEPIEGVNYENLLNPFKEEPKLLVFQTIHSFWQSFSFDEIVPYLCDPLSGIYILEMHPQSQFELQEITWPTKGSIKSVLLANNSNLIAFTPYLTKLILANEYDQLYQSAKRYLSRILIEKYGLSRCFAVDRYLTIQEWLDPYKMSFDCMIDLGPLPIDYIQQVLDENKRTQRKRTFQFKQKIKIAHVVPQIVDGQHAPTRLLKSLTLNCSKNNLEILIISTECFSLFSHEYPFQFFDAELSIERGKQSIKEFKQKDIDVIISPSSIRFTTSASFVNGLLSEHEIDLVVYHGPDQINMISTTTCDVPKSVFFDHGTPKIPVGFDAAILSNESTLNRLKTSLNAMQTKGFLLPFCVDAKVLWENAFSSKENLGFAENSFVMTTISNHLDRRLSKEMCEAIGKILQRCPNAVYAPMGAIEDIKKYERIFSRYGVVKQIKFLGFVPNPSQLARSMDLYLNEFPFGSGLAILDAMAAGCPVVTMYDKNGSPQAMYGGVYFGIEKAITAGNIDEYIDLACRLATDHTFYKQWSDYALKQYAHHANVKHYAYAFEMILKNILNIQQ